jgi:hypothetical protein
MKSVTNIVASKDGMKASIFASCLWANGATAASPASINKEMVRVVWTWRGVAGTRASEVSGRFASVAVNIESCPKLANKVCAAKDGWTTSCLSTLETTRRILVTNGPPILGRPRYAATHHDELAQRQHSAKVLPAT